MWKVLFTECASHSDCLCGESPHGGTHQPTTRENVYQNPDSTNSQGFVDG